MNHKLLLSLAAILVTSVAALMVWFYQGHDVPVNQPVVKTSQMTQSSDTVASQTHLTDRPDPNNTVTVVSQPNNAAASKTPQTTVADNSVYGTGLPAYKNDPVKLEQRRRVFTQMATVTNDMSRGIAPDNDTVLTLVDETVALTKEGYVPKQDAINSLNFLKKAIPALDLEISRRMQALNAL